jgi:hypothetical protein
MGPTQPERTTLGRGRREPAQAYVPARTRLPSKQCFDGYPLGGGDDLQDEGT